MTSVAEGWEERVASFIEDNRPLLEDPNFGPLALDRLCAQSRELVTALDAECVQISNRIIQAEDGYIAAREALRCSAAEVNGLEKEWRCLQTEYGQLALTYYRLESFLSRAKSKLGNGSWREEVEGIVR